MMRALGLAALLLLAAASPASAHIVSSRLGDFYGGALHPLTALPDVVIWLALGLVAALQPPHWARWIVLAFPPGLLAGFVAGIASGWNADPIALDAALMIGLGLLAAAAARLPGGLLLVLAVIVGGVRGAANASGLEVETDATLFGGGLLVAGYIVVTLIAALAATFRRAGAPWRTIALQAGGSWIAAIGLMVGGFALAGS
jgi:urease accessory protein